ncbi:MAG: polymer-forming cytoskeletal protein [Acidobacteria bacterium]|nr:polymer-forming cytoskeletal protein [Acidobacteriota bacterium]
MALFKKDRSDESVNYPMMEVENVAPVETRRAAAPGPQSPSGGSVIGKGLKFVGTITGDEDLTIDGTVEGEIKTSRVVAIGPGGFLKANVHGESVMVLGRVVGNISADQKVVLKPTAKVEGNITCVSFVVNEGASFEGNINMRQAAKNQGPRRNESEIPREDEAISTP